MADLPEDKEKPQDTPAASDDKENPTEGDKATDTPSEDKQTDQQDDAGSVDKPTEDAAASEEDDTAKKAAEDAKALEPLDPDVAAKEEEKENLDKVYAELERAKEDIELTGAVSQECMVSLEAVCPGIMLDNYPAGGYTNSNFKLALEAINFKQTMIIGGLITAIIGIIIAVLRALGLAFGRSSSNTATAVEKTKENIDKLKDNAAAQKDIAKVTDNVTREVAHSKDISLEEKVKFVTLVNERLGTNFNSNENIGTLIDKTIDHVLKAALDNITKYSNDVVIEAYHNPQGVNGRVLNIFVAYNADLAAILAQIRQDFMGLLKYAENPGDILPKKLPLPKYVQNATFIRHASKIKTDTNPADFVNDIAVGTPTQPKITLRSLDDVVRWNENINKALSLVEVEKKNRHEVEEISLIAQDYLRKYTRYSVDQGEASDDEYREIYRHCKIYLEELLRELHRIRAMNTGNNVLVNVLTGFSGLCTRTIDKSLTDQKWVLQTASNVFKDVPGLKANVKEQLADAGKK